MTYREYLTALESAESCIKNARAMAYFRSFMVSSAALHWKKEATDHLEAALEHCHDALGALTEPFDPEPGEEGAAPILPAG